MSNTNRMMSPEEDSSTISNLKAALRKATFHYEMRADNVIVYRFDNLSREVFIQWVDHFRSFQSKWTPPLRILYDFRGSGPPSRFMTDRLPGIMSELALPEDTRSAFAVDDNLNGHFTRQALAAIPKEVGETRSFVNINPAIQWLKEEVK